jgi:hypothetical protein
MKKLLIFTFMLTIFGAKAQIVYDYSKGKFDTTQTFIKYGESATLIIKNINMFRHQVNISGENISYITNPPKELDTLFRMAKEEEDTAKKAGDAMNQLKTTASIEIKKDLDSLLDSCKIYFNAIDKVNSAFLYYNQLVNITKLETDNYDVLIDNLKLVDKSSNYKKDFAEFKATYQKAYNSYEKTIDKSKSDEQRKTIEEALLKIEKSYFNLLSIYTSLFLEIENIRNKIKNDASFVAKSFPIQAFGDEINYTVKIGKIGESMDNAPSFDKTVPIKGGIKTEFSVGPVFSFGKNIIDDVPMLTRNTKDSTDKISLNTSNKKMKPGIAAMMHITFRQMGSFSPALLFGVGSGFESLSTINTNFIFGFSGVLGRQTRKVYISAGYNFQQVDKLKDKYQENSSYKGITPETIVEKAFRAAPFFSVSYSIGKKTSN